MESKESRPYVYYAADDNEIFTLSIPPSKDAKAGAQLCMYFQMSEASLPTTIINETVFYIGEL